MNLYAWNYYGGDLIIYTKVENPTTGTYIYDENGVLIENETIPIPDYGVPYKLVNTVGSYTTNPETQKVYSIGIDGVYRNDGGVQMMEFMFDRDAEDDISDNFISKFKHNNVTYTIKDAKAREDILNKQDKIDANNKLSASLISGLATVATTGSYNDLSNKPTIPAAQVNSDWNASSGVAEILNKPTIPTVNDSTITFTQGGTTKGTITLNQSSNSTIALDAGGGDSLPSQTGNAGKFLTTDGTDASWAEVQGSSSTITYFDSTNWTLDVTNTILSTGLSLGNNVNVFKNGQLIEPGASNDYTISGNNIVFTDPLTSTDKVAVVNGNMNPMQSVGYNTFSNKSVLATDWVADNTYSGYGYKCDIPCTGVTSTMYAQVTFNPEEAMSGNYTNTCDTGTGVVTIYSKVAEAITIPMIMVLGV